MGKKKNRNGKPTLSNSDVTGEVNASVESTELSDNRSSNPVEELHGTVKLEDSRKNLSKDFLNEHVLGESDSSHIVPAISSEVTGLEGTPEKSGPPKQNPLDVVESSDQKLGEGDERPAPLNDHSLRKEVERLSGLLEMTRAELEEYKAKPALVTNLLSQEDSSPKADFQENLASRQVKLSTSSNKDSPNLINKSLQLHLERKIQDILSGFEALESDFTHFETSEQDSLTASDSEDFHESDETVNNDVMDLSSSVEKERKRDYESMKDSLAEATEMAVKSVKAIEDLQTENMLLRGKLGHLEAKLQDVKDLPQKFTDENFKELESRIVQVESERQNVQSERDRLQKIIDEKEEKDSHFKVVSAELEKLRSLSVGKQNEIDVLKQHIAEQEKQKWDHAREMEEKDRTIESLKSTIENLENEIEEGKGDLLVAERQVERFSVDLSEKDSQLEDFKKQILAVETENEKLRVETKAVIDDANQTVERLKNDHLNLDKKLQLREVEIEEHKREAGERKSVEEQEREKLKHKLLEAERNLTQVEQNYVAASEELNQVKSMLMSRENELVEASSKIHSLGVDNQSATQRGIELETECVTLKDQISSLIKEKEQLSGDLEVAKGSLADSQQNLSKVHEELFDQKSLLAMMTTEMSETRRKVDELESEKQVAADSIMNLKSECASLTNELASKTRQEEKGKLENEVLLKTCAELEQKHVAIHEELRLSKSLVEQKEIELKKVFEKLTVTETENQVGSDKINKLETEHEALVKKVSDLTQQLEEKKGKLKIVNEELTQTKSGLISCSNKLDQAKSLISEREVELKDNASRLKEATLQQEKYRIELEQAGRNFDELNTRFSGATDELKKVQSLLLGSESKLLSIQEKASKFENECENFKDKVCGLTKELSELKVENGELKGKLKKTSQGLEETKAKLEDMDARKNDAIFKLQEVNSLQTKTKEEAEKLSELVLQKEIAMEKLKEELSVAREKISEVSLVVDIKKREVDLLSEVKDELSAKIEEREGEIRQLRQNLAIGDRQAMRLKGEISEKEQNLSLAQKDLGVLHGELAELKQKVKILELTVKEKVQSISDLTANLKRVTKEAESERNLKEKTTKEKMSLEEELLKSREDFEKTITKKNFVISELEAHVGDVKKEVRSREIVLVSHEKEKDDLRKKVEKLEADFKSLVEEAISSVINAIGEGPLKEQIIEVKGKNEEIVGQSLLQSMKVVVSELESSRSSLDLHIQEGETKDSEIVRLKQELKALNCKLEEKDDSLKQIRLDLEGSVKNLEGAEFALLKSQEELAEVLSSGFSLEQEVEEKRKACELLEEEKDKLMEEISDLKVMLKAESEEKSLILSEMSSELESLKAELEITRAEVSEFEEAKQGLVFEVEEAKVALQGKLMELEGERTRAEGAELSLEEVREELDEQRKIFHEKLAVWNEDVNCLKLEKVKLERDLEKALKSLEVRDKQENNGKKITSRDFLVPLENEKQEIEVKVELAETKENAVKVKEMEVRVKDSELEVQLEKLKQKEVDVMAQLTSAEEKIQILEKEISSSEAVKSEMENSMSVLSEEIKSLGLIISSSEAAKSEMEKLMSTLSEENKSLGLIREELEAKVSNLEEVNSSMNLGLKEVEVELSQLKSQVKEKDGLLDSASQEIQEIRRKLNKEIVEHLEEVELLKVSLSKTEAQNEKLEVQILELSDSSKKLNDLEEFSLGLRAECESLREEVERISKDLLTEKGLLKVAESKCSELTALLSEKEQNSEKIKADLEKEVLLRIETEKKLESSENLVKDLTSQLAEKNINEAKVVELQLEVSKKEELALELMAIREELQEKEGLDSKLAEIEAEKIYLLDEVSKMSSELNLEREKVKQKDEEYKLVEEKWLTVVNRERETFGAFETLQKNTNENTVKFKEELSALEKEKEEMLEKLKAEESANENLADQLKSLEEKLSLAVKGRQIRQSQLNELMKYVENMEKQHSEAVAAVEAQREELTELRNLQVQQRALLSGMEAQKEAQEELLENLVAHLQEEMESGQAFVGTLASQQIALWQRHNSEFEALEEEVKLTLGFQVLEAENHFWDPDQMERGGNVPQIVGGERRTPQSSALSFYPNAGRPQPRRQQKWVVNSDWLDQMRKDHTFMKKKVHELAVRNIKLEKIREERQWLQAALLRTLELKSVYEKDLTELRRRLEDTGNSGSDDFLDPEQDEREEIYEEA